MSLKKLKKIVVTSMQEWQKDNISTWSAALAYYTVFSLAPLLLIAISIAGLFLSRQAIEGQLTQQIQGMIGKDGANLVQELLKNTSHPSTNILSTIIGIITLIIGALGVFNQLETTLDYIWRVESKSSKGIMNLIKNKLLNLSMIVVIGFLLIVSLVASTFLTYVTSMFNAILPFPGSILEILNFLISFAIISFLFSLIYKFLPNVSLPWKSVLIGGLVTSFLFTIGKTLIGLYLGRSGLNSTYGAAASMAVLLVWVYYTSQIVFFGAEFTKVYNTMMKEK